MPMHQNPKDRALGREDGAHGKPSKCPADADAWSYRSGFIEGCAARDAEIADNDLKAFEGRSNASAACHNRPRSRAFSASCPQRHLAPRQHDHEPEHGKDQHGGHKLVLCQHCSILSRGIVRAVSRCSRLVTFFALVREGQRCYADGAPSNSGPPPGARSTSFAVRYSRARRARPVAPSGRWRPSARRVSGAVRQNVHQDRMARGRSRGPLARTGGVGSR